MLPSSIRWRLPLSYGAISLLATFCLGTVLLLVLGNYYARLEREYLERNARSVAVALADLLQPAAALEDVEFEQLLQSQVNAFAYLMETRIQVFDAAGELVAASDHPEELQAVATLSLEVQAGDVLQSFSQTFAGDDAGEDYSTVLIIDDGATRYVSSRTVSGDEPDLLRDAASSLLPLDTPAQFVIGATADPDVRSPQTLRRPILSSGPGSEGEIAGYVELSHGPAFGRQVLNTVLWGLVIASAVAVLLATMAGWFISLRLSRPILQLATVTGKMATGDLSVRAPSGRRDELGLLAASFNSMAERVEATIMALRRFVADAAHELNTPLTALRTNIDLAEKMTPDNQYIAPARAQALRLQMLNDDLLRLSHLDSGLSVEALRPVDLGQLPAERGEVYAAQAEQAELDFAASWPDEPLMVTGSREYLQRALDNLVDNAIKFTPPGGKVTVEAYGEPGWALIDVRDTGIGIEEDEATLIFNRFHRGRNAADYPGSGLGLAIVKTIADTHEGSVSLESSSMGTRVVLRLPRISP